MFTQKADKNNQLTNDKNNLWLNKEPVHGIAC